jgi:Ca-activated chloride channel homolog
MCVGYETRSDAMSMTARTMMAAMAVVAWQAAIGAQATFRSATELVNLNVTVTGADANPVAGLTQDQFEVLEDGVPQTVQFFAPGDMPLDVVILLDTSGSMAESMTLVQQAALRFAHALRPTDRVSVMGISSGLRVLQSLTSDMAAVDLAIKSTRAAGRTPLYASIYTALTELAKIKKADGQPRRQAIVVLSDGHDTSSAFGFDELLPMVQRRAVPIYTIAPRAKAALKMQREVIFGESTHRQDFELRKLAGDTGARAFFPVELRELRGVYEDIASELAHQYAIGYQSSNRAHDGAFRHIALRITAPGVKWRARTGYLAEHGRASASAGGQ